MGSQKTKCAIIGSGNIGTDLMMKIIKTSDVLEAVAMVGIDPNSDGLAKAKALGLATTAQGIDGLTAMPEFAGVEIVFDATSAGAHSQHDKVLGIHGKQVIDLTPAAVGPYVVPAVNFEEHLAERNINMVTCGGQATIPMVHAVRRVSERLPYAEIVASIASKSAGPGTRANIDEFTDTTARAIERVGGAERGKAIIVLNPAEPPVMMRDTIFTLSQGAEPEAIVESVNRMIGTVQRYVPGYRLKQEIQFERFGSNNPVRIPGLGEFEGLKSMIFLEVEGAAHYLPAYAGNLDVMTSAALAAGEKVAALKFARTEAAE